MLVAVGVLLTTGVALLMWVRPPDRRIAVLLFVLAAAYAVRGLAASDNSVVFTVARALGQVTEFVLVWVMLAFPTGRLRRSRDRMIVGAAAFAATVLWIPTLLFSAAVPLPGRLVPCDPDCPTNALLVSDMPALAAGFQATFRIVSVAVLVATALSLLERLVHASPVTRRTLTPLFVVSILRTLGVAVFVASGGSLLSGIALVVLFWAVPLSMALGLLLARLYTAAALLRLVSGLQRRPDGDALRIVMADALEDPGLAIAYWLPDRNRWVDSTGELHEEPPLAGSGQAVTIARTPGGDPLAAIEHDEALLEQPALLEAVTASTRMALESNQAQARLALSDAKVADAEGRARRALERDLHDGAQQRLIALRMKVSVLNRLLDQDVRRAAELARELGPDMEAALAEIREVAHGAGPGLLVDQGLEVALTEAAGRAPMPARLLAEGVGRYPPTVEAAVYFTCQEALQNAAKHSGPGSTVTVELADDGRWLTFSVHDDGSGAGPVDVTGHGVSNMRERIAACGGELSVDSRSGAGVTVHGRVPLR